ncbi:hypothetical protein DM02DRAFT_729579 [Periconia macrospinosa]|uniref:Uncharacterized protein n=1 Tax=Periconia macrospinosa TaxID=97972 RepID=A0A2V1DL74_9PLEO|nr:hypothetical protein DM02DRAFT_729579 [Periconia macrospinosa]
MDNMEMAATAVAGIECINEEIKKDLLFGIGELPEEAFPTLIAILLLRSDLGNSVRRPLFENLWNNTRMDLAEFFDKGKLGYPSLSLGNGDDTLAEQCAVCSKQHLRGEVVYPNECEKHKDYNRCIECKGKSCPLCIRLSERQKSNEPQKLDEPEKLEQQSSKLQESSELQESNKPEPQESNKPQDSDEPQKLDELEKLKQESDGHPEAQDSYAPHNSANMPEPSQSGSALEYAQYKEENSSNAYNRPATSPIESARLQRELDL